MLFADAQYVALSNILYLVILLFILISLLRRSTGKCATVVVLGDIGRSPRMQYHSISLAQKNVLTTIIGYVETTPHSLVAQNRKIRLRGLQAPPSAFRKLPRMLELCAKVFWQSCTLLILLLFTPRAQYVILQSAPALPAMAVCWFVCRIRGSCLVIDWHNYSYTLLGLSMGPQHAFVKVATWYEHVFGRLADVNLCVTKAMKSDLAENWGISAHVVYDRPPDMFHPIDVTARYQLLSKLSSAFKPLSKEKFFVQSELGGSVTLKASRPALIISSTSWTEDEDFGLLLDALEKYEEEAENCALPDVLCVITGKGPQKSHYMSIIDSRRPAWRHIDVITPWLEADDYPKMLAACDLGICLHKSSSGLDLPMKVVDMFGCCLPVCAVNYSCIEELVRPGENGLVFNDSHQLTKQLKSLLTGFPQQSDQLATFRTHLQSNFATVRWSKAWDDNVWPLLTDVHCNR